MIKAQILSFFHGLKHLGRQALTKTNGVLVFRKIYIPLHWTYIGCHTCGKVFLERQENAIHTRK